MHRRAQGRARFAPLLLLIVAATLGVVSAQNETEASIEAAESAVLAAEAGAAAASPDAPLWAEAIARAREAVETGGDAPDPAALRWLARAYQGSHWWARAYLAWERLAAQVGPLEGEDLTRWREAASQLAFARYEAGDREAAERRFREILERLPGDLGALRWSGRIALEADRPAEAAEFWRLLVELAPEDEGARYHLELAREREAHGRSASDAFRSGVASYRAGELEAALNDFERAFAADPSWTEPARWRARVLYETARPEATEAWRQLAERLPNDEGVAWFLSRSRLQDRIGATALQASDEAREATERGDRAAAVDAWRRAVVAAPEWRDARLGLARAATAAGQAELAERTWLELLDSASEQDLNRAEIERGLATSRRIERLGVELARTFTVAVEAYEAGRVDEAVAGFERVVAGAPQGVEAWSWLGRIAFARGDWSDAARAYERASSLAPEDEDLAFFASEARALAGPEPDRPEGP